MKREELKTYTSCELYYKANDEFNHVINHQKMYEELRATKHALWMTRAMRGECCM